MPLLSAGIVPREGRVSPRYYFLFYFIEGTKMSISSANKALLKNSAQKASVNIAQLLINLAADKENVLNSGDIAETILTMDASLQNASNVSVLMRLPKSMELVRYLLVTQNSNSEKFDPKTNELKAATKVFNILNSMIKLEKAGISVEDYATFINFDGRVVSGEELIEAAKDEAAKDEAETKPVPKDSK